MNKHKKVLNKWRYIPCLWIGRVIILKISVLPNLICRFDELPMKIPVSYFMDINKLILKFIWRGKRSRTANTVLKENNNVGRLTLLNFTTYHKPTVIKTVWYRWKNRQVDQRNRLESLEIHPHKYSQLILDKGTKAM